MSVRSAKGRVGYMGDDITAEISRLYDRLLSFADKVISLQQVIEAQFGFIGDLQRRVARLENAELKREEGTNAN